jgi:hypothetical protein
MLWHERVRTLDAFGQAERAGRRFVPVLTVNGGDVVFPGGPGVDLRLYTAADREVDCGAPLISGTGAHTLELMNAVRISARPAEPVSRTPERGACGNLKDLSEDPPG